MKNLAARAWKEDDGVLTFEWILLITLLTIGIVSGLSSVRDALIDELGDVAQAIIALDQSYSIDHPLVHGVHTSDLTRASNSGFADSAIFLDHCLRGNLIGQPGLVDCGSNTSQPLP